jgi:1-aminocyclopropane-1-carboxylate deaminase
VPEGGSDLQGLAGAASIDLSATPAGTATQLVLATGSGGTLAGMARTFGGHVTGIDVVGDDLVKTRLADWLTGFENWQLQPSVDGAGYGRFSAETLDACIGMLEQGVVFEPIYTGKAWLSLLRLLEQGQLPAGERYVMLHSGGLQGLQGLAARGLITPTQWQLFQQTLVQQQLLD